MNRAHRKPTFSVICPTYNRSRAITDTIASVQRQTFPDWELLVVSDASSDDTDTWVTRCAADDPRIRLIRTRRHGHPSGPRNTGAAAAEGACIAYLDHDDQWRDDHLEVLLSAFTDGAELVATGCVRLDRAGRETSRTDVTALCWHPETQLLSAMFEPSRVAHRRALLDQVGGWRDGHGLEDWDLWLRLSDAGHRFTTMPDRTASLLDDVGTRRYRMLRRRRLTLAAFEVPQHAQALQQELQRRTHVMAFRAARLADTLEWYDRMEATGGLVVPRGFAGSLAAQITRESSSEEGRTVDLSRPDLVVTHREGLFEVSQVLWCTTEEHADRISRLVRVVQARQFALIDQLAQEVTSRHVDGVGSSVPKQRHRGAGDRPHDLTNG
ncbi:hypothetical protein GCM10010430_02600 [Kitasatospora cystarginea]|uniref:Glycosyltransferase 2-like domain-containing protein n=1 Tax=Kitasatospora cystarginea TaxID=58350 RepID=A0ABN3DC76_9ACTN